MADAFHIGYDDPGITGSVLPVPDQPFAAPAPATPDRPNPTDPDWSNFPEARTSSKGPDGDTPSAYPFSNFWSQHSGPQESPKPDGSDIVGSTTGDSLAPPPPVLSQAPASAPDAAGLPTQPAPPTPLTADQQMQEWLHPTTPEGKQVAHDIDAITSGFHAAWENDTIFGGLQNATSDAIGNIVEGAKAKLGVTLEDPMHGGYMDEAVQRVIAERSSQSWGSYFNPINPEGFFGGGTAFTAAVQKAQMDIFDEKRQALAEKIKGDTAYDRAGANSDALSLLDPDTPAAALGAKYSHQANVNASQALDAAGNSLSARIGNLFGGMAGGVRDPVNDLSLIVGGGAEPYLAKTYFPLAPKALQIASNITEAGVRQALINMGLTAVGEPEHQSANAQRGEESGLQPALHDIEDAGLSGFLPGAFMHGVHALMNLHGPDSKAWIDEFIRQAQGSAPDAPMSAAGRAFMDEVHAYEDEKGLPRGSTYADIGRNRPQPPPEQGRAGATPPPEPPPAGPQGPPKLLTGPREFPKSPDLPESSRNRPSPSSITPEAVRGAETDAEAMPGQLPGVPPSEHIRAYTEAVRNAEAPDVMAPPEPPMYAPPAADANFLPPDHLPAAAQGVVQRTAGYDGPHADLLQNRIEHLQSEVENPDIPEKTAREFRRRIRDFQSHIENRNAALEQAGVPAEQAAAIRGLRPGDVVTGKTLDGEQEVTGEISGWESHTVGIQDSNGIDHSVAPATITKIAKGARSGAINSVPSMAPGQVFAHNGKPVTAGLNFPARDLQTDANTYQYKRGGDANGVTERLQTVKQWSPLSSGNVVVHERLDGQRYIVDGHQRRGLANRIMDADPTQNISLPGFLFKEADGWTPEDVRAEAAAKNIREGLGDTLDIARILRDKPEIWDDSLPIGRGDMKEARGLANLSDEGWGMVVNGKPRTDFASFVGNMAADKSTHLAILDDLVKFDPRTQNEARMIIADAMQAGFNRTEQTDLFGTHEVTESLRGERSKVYAAAERLLSSDKKIFGMLDAEASRIIEAGNVLTDTNAERADRAGQLAQGLIQLAQRAGPVSAALNRAAQRVADGESPKTSARAFLNELPALLQEEGLRVAEVAAPPKYDLDSPKGREEQVHDLEAEFMASQPGMFGETLPHTDYLKQQIADLNKFYAAAHNNIAKWKAIAEGRAINPETGEKVDQYTSALVKQNLDKLIAEETAARDDYARQMMLLHERLQKLQGVDAEGDDLPEAQPANDLGRLAHVAVDDAIAAAKDSPDPLDQKIGEIIEREIAPLLPPASVETPRPYYDHLREEQGASTGANNATQNHSMLRARIEAAYLQATGGGRNRFVSFDKIRPLLPDVPRADLDQALMQMAKGDVEGGGAATLMSHDDPRQITPAMRDAELNATGQSFHGMWLQSHMPKYVKEPLVYQGMSDTRGKIDHGNLYGKLQSPFWTPDLEFARKYAFPTGVVRAIRKSDWENVNATWMASHPVPQYKIVAALRNSTKENLSEDDFHNEAIRRASPATEAGPDGAQQTLAPGVEPVTDAARARVGAEAPLRGGNAEMPTGGLFDDLSRAQRDFFQMTPTEDGLKSRQQMEAPSPLEVLAAVVKSCPDP